MEQLVKGKLFGRGRHHRCFRLHNNGRCDLGCGGRRDRRFRQRRFGGRAGRFGSSGHFRNVRPCGFKTNLLIPGSVYFIHDLIHHGFWEEGRCDPLMAHGGHCCFDQHVPARHTNGDGRKRKQGIQHRCRQQKCSKHDSNTLENAQAFRIRFIYIHGAQTAFVVFFIIPYIFRNRNVRVLFKLSLYIFFTER